MQQQRLRGAVGVAVAIRARVALHLGAAVPVAVMPAGAVMVVAVQISDRVLIAPRRIATLRVRDHQMKRLSLQLSAHVAVWRNPRRNRLPLLMMKRMRTMSEKWLHGSLQGFVYLKAAVSTYQS